jgi:hypothetical protein
MRVAIVGNSGSGKSALGGQIAAVHAIASLDLDTVAWQPGKIAVARARGRRDRCEGFLFDARSVGRRRVLCGARRIRDLNGYHETITTAYVRPLEHYLDRCHTDMPLDMRALDLLAGSRPLGQIPIVSIVTKA